MNSKAELLNLVGKYIEDNYDSELAKFPSIRYCLDLSVEDDEEEECEVDEESSTAEENFALTLKMMEIEEKPRQVTKKNKKRSDTPLYPQKYIERDIRYITSQLETTWCSEVFWIIDENNYKDSEVYKRAGISKQTFSKFRMNIEYKPKRDTAIQMCIGLKLNLDQAVDLLSKAGFSLSKANKRDLVVKYFIENNIYDIDELNYVLFEFKLELFNIA